MASDAYGRDGTDGITWSVAHARETTLCAQKTAMTGAAAGKLRLVNQCRKKTRRTRQTHTAATAEGNINNNNNTTIIASELDICEIGFFGLSDTQYSCCRCMALALATVFDKSVWV